MEKAIINKIIPFSTVDGPGNRTAIFFQSCPFECAYCHNPETIHLCNHCGKCVSHCPTGALTMVDHKVKWNKSICVGCDECIKSCMNLSSPKTITMSVDEVVEIIKRNKPFIRGITVSGGECMQYASFLTELFTQVKALGLSTYIDSNGYYDFSLYPDLLSVTDFVMLDVKAYDNTFHALLTKKNNETVLKNLRYLLDIGKMYEVRTVLLNGQEEQNLNTVLTVSKIIQNRCRYKLIRYRPYGVLSKNLTHLGSYEFPLEELEHIGNKAKEIMSNIVTI